MGCLLSIFRRSNRKQEEVYEKLRPQLSPEKEFDAFMKEDDPGTSLIDDAAVLSEDSDEGPVLNRKQSIDPIDDEPALL